MRALPPARMQAATCTGIRSRRAGTAPATDLTLPSTARRSMPPLSGLWPRRKSRRASVSMQAQIKTADGELHSVRKLEIASTDYGTHGPRRSTHSLLSWRTAMLHYPHPPFPNQHQPMPGKTAAMNPAPDHGEESYKGSGRLNGKKAVITGGDSGIGRAIAIAYAREGADVLISYLDEHEDAEETARYVKEAGRKAVLFPGDITSEETCKQII